MRLMLCLILLTLAGCASYADRMDEPPAYTGQTDKSPDEFLACAMPVAMTMSHTARIVPDNESKSIVVAQELTGNTLLTLTARPDGRVEWRSIVPGSDGMRAKWQEVSACL